MIQTHSFNWVFEFINLDFWIEYQPRTQTVIANVFCTYIDLKHPGEPEAGEPFQGQLKFQKLITAVRNMSCLFLSHRFTWEGNTSINKQLKYSGQTVGQMLLSPAAWHQISNSLSRCGFGFFLLSSLLNLWVSLLPSVTLLCSGPSASLVTLQGSVLTSQLCNSISNVWVCGGCSFFSNRSETMRRSSLHICPQRACQGCVYVCAGNSTHWWLCLLYIPRR